MDDEIKRWTARRKTALGAAMAAYFIAAEGSGERLWLLLR